MKDRAKDTASGETVAMKRMKLEREKEGFPLTALREINLLLRLKHPHIIDVKEVVIGNSLDEYACIRNVVPYFMQDLYCYGIYAS